MSGNGFMFLLLSMCVKMDREKNFTSTANKLLKYPERLKAISEDGLWHPINLQISPTEICNLNCSFCSVKNRGNLSLEIDEMKNAIIDFNNLGLQSIEITGGGEPTLHPKINELIRFAYSLGLKIGLITNGIALDNVSQKNLDKLSWLRISLNGIDEDKTPNIPEIKGTLGFSYVWNEKSNILKLKYIYGLAMRHNVEYVRVVPNCLNIEEQKRLRTEVGFLVKELGFEDKIFIQTKSYEIYPKCWIGGLKPFLYSDGFIYQCSAVALYNRKFSPEWRICYYNDINKIWPNNYKPLNNKMCRKGKCFYSDQNKLLDELQMEVKHDGFI